MSEDRSSDDGTIRLTVPSYPQYVRVVRLTAAGSLTLRDCSMNFVEDVRAALSEACALVMGESGHPGELVTTISFEREELCVDVRGVFAVSPPRDANADVLSERLLEPLVDKHEVDLASDRVVFRKTFDR